MLAEMQHGTTSPENSLAVSYKGNTLLAYDPAIALTDVYPRETKTCIHTKTCTGMLVAAFCTNHPQMETPWLSFSGERMNYLQHVHTMEYHLVIKRNGPSFLVTTQQNAYC